MMRVVPFLTGWNNESVRAAWNSQKISDMYVLTRVFSVSLVSPFNDLLVNKSSRQISDVSAVQCNVWSSESSIDAVACYYFLPFPFMPPRNKALN